MRAGVPLLCLLVLAACAAPGSRPIPTGTPEESLVATSEPTPIPSLTVASDQPSRAPSGSDEELTGFLGADSIEGGCGYLEVPDGTRYQVTYPDGWRLQLSPLQLTSPDGEVVARGGDEVTVRGAETSDMASICQIGPIFRATEVVAP